MPHFQFPEWTDKFKKWVALLFLGGPIYVVFLWWYGISPAAIRIGYQPEQPVPYSHALHAGELGMDCRYCHNTVEKAGHAAVPPAQTCMNCHTGIFPESPNLAPVRESASGGEPVKWVRVNDLPDYVYFNHSAHVNHYVGCESCHGRVDQMKQVYQAKPLTMEWCLGCHNNPEPNLRAPENITKMGFEESEAVRKDLAKNVNPPINCSTCHR